MGLRLVLFFVFFQFHCVRATLSTGCSSGHLMLARVIHTFGDLANYCLRTPDPTRVVICVGTAFLACLKFLPGLFWEDSLGAATPKLVRMPRSGEQAAACEAYIRAILYVLAWC